VFWHRKSVQQSDDTLRTLKNSIEDLQSDVRRLRGEWEDALDRFERIMGRLNKRAQRDAPPPPADGVGRPVRVNGAPEAEVPADPLDEVLIRRSGRRWPPGS
jgi:hypothetical protein